MPTNKEPEFHLSYGVAIDVKDDMRDKLVANLRDHVKQSKMDRQTQILEGPQTGKKIEFTVRFPVADSEPQSVLITNRSASLTNEVLRLRSRYANLLTEGSDD